MAFKELNGSGIHRLQNIITLHSDVHTFFDTLQLWLEPVEGVSNPLPRVNWGFNRVFRRTYPPIPTKSVWLMISIRTSVGSLL